MSVPSAVSCRTTRSGNKRTKWIAIPVAPKKRSHPTTTADNTCRKHPSLKDKDGHLVFQPNCLLQSRYKTLSVLGKGTFGQVFRCKDTVRNTLCAVKVIRALRKYYDASQIEIRVLECLKQHDSTNEFQCIQLRATFQHDGHVCMVFDLLQLSLFDYMKLNTFAPFPLYQIRDMAYQLLKSIAFLHRRKLIHTDLKPENIMLDSIASKQEHYIHPHGNLEKRRVLKDTSIQLIDFGSATFENEFHSATVSTRHYRAPEIILGLGWSFPCDIWSLGCVLYELYTGETLFQTRVNDIHLVLMEATIGALPAHMLASASANVVSEFEAIRHSCDEAKTTKPLYERAYQDTPPHKMFVDLMYRMLTHDPIKRITAENALKHPLFGLPYIED